MKAYRRSVVSPWRVPSAVCQLDIVNKLLIARIAQRRATTPCPPLGHKQTFCAVETCPHYSRKPTFQGAVAMSAKGEKRTSGERSALHINVWSKLSRQRLLFRFGWTQLFARLPTPFCAQRGFVVQLHFYQGVLGWPYVGLTLDFSLLAPREIASSCASPATSIPSSLR